MAQRGSKIQATCFVSLDVYYFVGWMWSAKIMIFVLI